MNLAKHDNPAMPVPACAGSATGCAAIGGREVTCPAAIQRTCQTLAAIRRIAPVADRPGA